jgi:hypothetical protein
MKTLISCVRNDALWLAYGLRFVLSTMAPRDVDERYVK